MTELRREDSERLVGQLAQRISRSGLVTPSLVFLEVAKPFSFIASQGLLLCQPILSFLVQESLVVDWADLLADRENVDQLIAHLEQATTTRSSNGKGED